MWALMFSAVRFARHAPCLAPASASTSTPQIAAARPASGGLRSLQAIRAHGLALRTGCRLRQPLERPPRRPCEATRERLAVREADMTPPDMTPPSKHTRKG